MNLIITDSGFGGLAVCALVIQRLLSQSVSEEIHIKYVNAAPSDEMGYNSMPSRSFKIEMFHRALKGMSRLYDPQSIFVACNSLSALLEEVPFVKEQQRKIQGMIPVAIQALVRASNPSATTGIVVLATETTIAENIYPLHLQQAGVQVPYLVSQACPGLATAISNDPEGNAVYPRILEFVKQALQIQPPPGTTPLLCLLGCTHYGYRDTFFKKAFAESGYPEAVMINPNLDAAARICQEMNLTPNTANPKPPRVSVEFISPYPLPEREVGTISQLLAPLSMMLVEALRHYTLRPDLFE